MQSLYTYINEAIDPQTNTGISAFEWGDITNLPHVVIDNLIQRLPGMGYTQTQKHVNNMEYKVSHNGYCLTIGVRARSAGEGTRTPSCKIFIRECTCGKLSIVEKYLNIDGDGKAVYKVLSLKGDKFVWAECEYKDLPKCGDIDDSVEFAELFTKKIMARTKRYTK